MLTKREMLLAATCADNWPKGQGMFYLRDRPQSKSLPATVALIENDPSLLQFG